MKKIVLILYTAAVFIFCSCDKNNDKPTCNYLDNKLIEGKWFAIVGKDSMLYTFKDNRARYEYYAYILGWEDTLKVEDNTDLGRYLLTDSLIMLPERPDIKLRYKLFNNNNDSIYIGDPIVWVGLKRLKR